MTDAFQCRGTWPIYQVDAFASEMFRGNPAAVVPMTAWPDAAVMQAIAAENNLAETAFLVPEAGCDYRIRWFTPAVEVDLCGHATLASAHVLWQHCGHDRDDLHLASKSGPLRVRREGELLELDFPSVPMTEVAVDPAVVAALGATPSLCLTGMDLLCVFEDAAAVQALTPDMPAVRDLSTVRGVIATAPGADGVDFVSRFFGPQVGVDEDHVTGSAHCALTPYWSARLGRQVLTARQISTRGGELRCTLAEGGDRVRLAGRAVTYLEGAIRAG